MVNFFRTVLDEAEDKVIEAGEPFVTNRIGDEQIKLFENCENEIEAFRKKHNFPFWLSIVQFLAAIAGLFCLFVFISLIEDDLTFTEAYASYAALLYLGIAFLLTSAALFISEKAINKRALASEEHLALERAADETVKAAERQLEIPPQAKKIDFLNEVVIRKKNGKEKPLANQFGKYTNYEEYVYVRNGNLCLSDLYTEYSVPLASLKKIRAIRKSASFSPWNKEESPRSPRYRSYRLRTNAYGVIYCKPCYSVWIEDERGEFELLLPNYELESFNSLVHLPVDPES